MKKKKIFNFIVDVLLIGIVLSITDAVSLKVFHSENFWLELGIYLVLYTIAFGTKRGIGNKDDYKLDIEKGLGNITVDGTSVSNIKGQGNGNNSIEISGGIGAINLKFKESEAK